MITTKVVFPGQGLAIALCAEPCDFPKCEELDCIICGSGGLHSRSPLKINIYTDFILCVHLGALR